MNPIQVNGFQPGFPVSETTICLLMLQATNVSSLTQALSVTRTVSTGTPWVCEFASESDRDAWLSLAIESGLDAEPV